MRHIFDIDILSRHIDKRWPKPVADRLESHLAVCPLCKSNFVVLQNSVTALKSLESLELASDFDSVFNRRLDEAIKRREEEKIFKQVARRALDGIRAIQLRPAPVLVKAIASIVLALAIGFATLQYLGVVSPSIISAKGKVEIFDKSKNEWKIAQLELKPDKGDIIRTAQASQINLEIPQMYSIRIKENSEIEVINLTRRRVKGVASFNLKGGRVLIDIGDAFRGSEFKILTPTAEAKALGTKFMVEVAKDEEETTWIGVLEGEVEVKSTYKPPLYAVAEQTVIVGAGQKTEVSSGSVPLAPQRLLDREWKQIQELYQIGHKPQVALLISTGIHRVRELLRPCPIYISDEEPRAIPTILEEAIVIINEAIEGKDEEKHLEAIKKLEEIVEEHPDPRYNPQFLLFIGAYYNYIDLYEEAINTLEKVVDRYPKSSLASLAQCAIGIIYEEGLKDPQRAIEAYKKVLTNYPNSPEISIAEEALSVKKAR